MKHLVTATIRSVGFRLRPWLRPGGLLTAMAIALYVGAVGTASASDTAPLTHSAPEDSLVRKLQPIVPAASLPSGVTVHQRSQWIEPLQALTIRGEAEIVRSAAEKPMELPLVELQFQLPSRGSRSGDAAYQRLAYRDDQWYGSTYWTGPNWTRVGKDWHHPGENTPSIRMFQAPRDGRVEISGRVYKLHLNGDGVRLSIMHNDRELWKAEIGGKDDQGVEPKLTVAVCKGDAIRFIVHKRGGIACDTTHWDPIVAYADGGRFQASKAFSTRQGNENWFYEMPGGVEAAQTTPTLRGLTAGLSHWQRSLEVGRPLIVTADEALPFFVLTEQTDAQNGVVLALDAADGWTLRALLEEMGRLRIGLVGRAEKTPAADSPAKTSLPAVVLSAYQGAWTRSATWLAQQIRSSADERPMARFAEAMQAAYRRTTEGLEKSPELDLFLLAQAEWRRDDKIVETAEAYSAAVGNHLARAKRLLEDLRKGQPEGVLVGEASRLEQLTARMERLSQKASPLTPNPSPTREEGSQKTAAKHPTSKPTDVTLAQWRETYLRARLLKRQIALSNPLLKFEKLLFAKRAPTSYSHLVMQYFGWRARPGGGLFVLDRPGYSLAARDILAGKLAEGSVLEPRLSYDARRVVFSWVACAKTAYDPTRMDHSCDEGFYHVYEAGTDGSGLRQLTSGAYDDLMPCYLPDGGIAFCSTRRRGHARCFGGQFSPRWHVYTLHRMDGDGGNVRILSVHDTNEWFPTVGNDGMLLYARWDYIDRDAVTHQNLWTTRPDGTNPAALWGNATPSPHCTFQPQPIPGSQKIVFAASAHHSITGGSVAIVDPTVAANGQQAITRITPEIPFPEAESRDIREYYSAPWPLSERYFLVAYSPEPLLWEPRANPANALGLYLLDAAGNRELIYRDAEIGCDNPTPLVSRPMPPALPSSLPPNAQPEGEMVVTDVYQGLGPIERGAIKELRIVEIFPKTTNVANRPPIGLAKEENARAILGTVPVEADGSARFVVPALTPVLFQALDQEGRAYQTMRSLTYVQPGERTACVGCHEDRMSAPGNPSAGPVMAMRRAASRIEPGELGGRPFSYVEVVQPVLDAKCVRCHGGEKTEGKIDLTRTPDRGFSRSYWALCGDQDFWGAGTNLKNAATALVPRFGGRNTVQVTPPGGLYGSIGSRLMRLIGAGHYDAKLTPAERRRLAAWIDLNAVFYGVYAPEEQAAQLEGRVVAMPEVR